MDNKAVTNLFEKRHIEQAKATAKKLYDSLPNHDNLKDNKVALLFGGGKDSAWMVAYTRLVQTIMQEEHGDTFTLRIFTGRQPSMQQPVMTNIDNSYKALGIYNNDVVETYIIHGSEVVPFSTNTPLPDDLKNLHRTDLLMNGHRFAADARRTFCDHCNVHLANWTGVAAGYNGGADFLITGESKEELKSYEPWTKKILGAAGIKAGTNHDISTQLTFAMVERPYAQEMYGDDKDSIKARHVDFSFPKPTKFFSMFDETNCSAKDHLNFLKDSLHFNFDTNMLSFSESDCGNPSLMAHLRGLASEKLFGSSYTQGVKEYAEFGINLMHKKDFPQELIDIIQDRYKDSSKINSLRSKVEQYAMDAYNLTPTQLTTMIYAPFASKGENLHIFLEREQPNLLKQEQQIRNVLYGSGEDKALANKLEEISGLPLKLLRRIFTSDLLRDPFQQAEKPSPKLLQAIASNDPHQGMITSKIGHGSFKGVPVVEERQMNISGR